MDARKLRAAIPNDEQFSGNQPHQKKQCVERFIGSILDALAADGRSPDAWEAHQLGIAIGFIGHGWYSASLAYANQAVTPEAERTEAPAPSGKLPTIEDLRRALAHYAAMPAAPGS